MKQAWELFKQHWKSIFGAIGSVVGFLFLRQYLQGDLKAKLLNQQTEAKDHLLNQVRDQVKEDLKEEAKNNQELRDKLKEPAPESNWKAVEDFYKNKK